MTREIDEPWSAAEIEEWEHDRWLKIKEMGEDFYKNEEEEDEMEDDPYEEEERRRWQEEEERAKEAFFQEIKKEEERGVFRQTVAELIEERSAARKLMKEMEKEEDKEDANSDKPGKCEEEAEVSTEREDKGASPDPPLQALDSPTFRQPNSTTDNDASMQKIPHTGDKASLDRCG